MYEMNHCDPEAPMYEMNHCKSEAPLYEMNTYTVVVFVIQVDDH